MTIPFELLTQDDPEFVASVQRLVHGELASLQPLEVYVVHIDNWFDFKWLRWWSWNEEKGLSIPAFNPNRVLSQTHFLRHEKSSTWHTSRTSQSLHVRQPGRSTLAQPIDQISESGAFVWYSGNTRINTMGSLMLYLSGEEQDCWYASFRKHGDWRINDVRQISRGELKSLEERGREIESVMAMPFQADPC